MSNNTFNHEAALQGARVTCGDYEIKVVWDEGYKKWKPNDTWSFYRWFADGTPLGDYPPLKTMDDDKG